MLPIVAATGATLAMTGFDQFGISDPAAVAIDPTGTGLLVADAANNWINPVPLDAFSDPPDPSPAAPAEPGQLDPGTGHPTDMVFGPGRSGAFVVDGFTRGPPVPPANHDLQPGHPGVLGGVLDDGGPGTLTGPMPGTRLHPAGSAVGPVGVQARRP